VTPRHRTPRTGIALALLVLTGCSRGAYRDLEAGFAAEGGPSGIRTPANRLFMVSTRHRGAFQVGGVQVFLSADAVEIRPRFPASAYLRNLRLPAASISACSMTCFGPEDRYADLLLEPQGAQVSVDAASELVEWCWQNDLPMASAAETRGWLYRGHSLPSRTAYARVSREDYEEQARRACLGH